MALLGSLGLAALGWVASPVVAKLLNEAFVSLGINAEEKLQELTVTVLPVLKSVIKEAERNERRIEVEEWLQRLKDAYDDAEDALDLLNYHHLEQKVASSSRRRTNRVRSSFRVRPKSLKWIMPVLKGSRDMLSLQKIKLRRSLNELEKIAGEAEKLRAWLGVQPVDKTAVVPNSRQTISLPPRKVFGRDKDREEIIRRLKTEPAATIHDSGSPDIPIIAIVGRPGVGKTTLAQYTYDKLEGEDCGRHFDLIMWVYASRNFNASEIMKKIIKQASIASEPQDPVNPDDLPAMIHTHLCSLGTNVDTMAVADVDSSEDLRQKMNKKLNAKKFFLVIDDVWCDREDHKKNWDTLFRCLSKCLRGSKILVTSQTDDAPRKIGASWENIYYLEELEENGFSDLFVHHALPSGEMDSSLREELKEKCEAIAQKLNKDPTTAKMVGETIAMKVADVLHSQDDLHTYLRTLAQKDWSGDKTKTLMWSYLHLPAYLQRCFSYCGLYPKGYKFKALELVQLWMAQGFIKPDDQNERMEDVGIGYLNELVSRFYIQRYNSYYTLHELLYNLAEKVSRNDCFRVKGNCQSKIPSTIRHLCIPANKLNENKEEICKLEKLRTLIVTGGESVTSEVNVATDIFDGLKKLRVLVLESYLEILAEFIGEMKHLRILRVSGTGKFVLPESVCTLYHLQVLEVENASSLPKFLNNLVSLRYLEANFDIISAIPDIGKLTSLQGLENFQVRKEKGYELEQLQSLNELRGRLCIANLENVESKDSAIAANLKEKTNLGMLRLVWHDGEDNVNSNLDVEILEGLQLPPNLTILHLDGYRGQLWPSWPESQTSNIQELVLEQCKMLEEIPPMDQLYPFCRSLKLSHLSKLKALHALPPRLQKIIIFHTPFLTITTNEDLQMSPAEKRSIIEVMRKSTQKWFPHQYQQSLVDSEKEMMNFIAAANDSDNEASSAEHDKSVPADDMDISAVWERWLEMHERKMELIYNRQNDARLLLPSTLTALKLEGCNITNHALSACLQAVTSLTSLELVEIRTITCLPSEDVLGKLKALQTLRLQECWALTSLGGIRSLPHLCYLILIGCPCLDTETAPFLLPSSLLSIFFGSCPDVDDILATAADLPCLSLLVINECRLRTISQFGSLRSLRSLAIMHCPGLPFSVDLQELHSLEFLILLNCANLQAVMNLPRSLKGLVVHKCPILEEQSVNIDPVLGVRMLGSIPVKDSFYP